MNPGKATARPATGAAGRRTPAAAPRESVPAWLAPAAYALVTLVLFREVVFAGGTLMGTDTYALSYFARDFYTDFVRETGRFPLWDPYLFGGLPFVEGMHGDIFYPLSLALFFLDPRAMWGWKMVLHVFLAGVFCYLWLRGIGVRRAAAFFGGLVFMMGADLVSLVYPGGDGKLFVSALAPLMFWLTDRAARRRRVADFAFFSLGLALVVFTSHMQLAYFTVWGVSLYFLFRVAQAWRADHDAGRAAAAVGGFALAGLLGVGAAAVQFLPPLGYLREWSHRADKTVQAEAASGYEYSATWSIHPEEAVSLVVPEFAGHDAATDTRPATYWGRNAFKLNHEYAGLIPLLLVPLLLLRRRDPTAVFFMVLAALAVCYALGANTPLFRLFYLIPGVNLFRAPSLIIFLYGLSVATLGALGLQRLLDWSEAGAPELSGARKALWLVTAIFGVLALLASAGAVIAFWRAALGVADEAKLQANIENIRLGFWIAFFFAAAVAGVAEGLARGLVTARTALVALALLAAVDLYRVDRPFIRATVLMGEYERGEPALFEADESIRFLQQRKANGEVFRVFDFPLQNAGTAYGNNVLAAHGLEQIAGHHGNEIGRYRTLVGGDGALNVGTSELRLLDLLNVEYLVMPQRVQAANLEEVFVGSRSAVYRNRNALPRAFLVGATEVVPDERAVERMLGPAFDARAVVLLPEPLPADIETQPQPQGSVSWTERGVNESTLRITTDRPALLVITDNYFPAWRAQVDGVPAPILRANYTFRAIPVGAGEHTLRLYYDSPVLARSAFASILLILGLLAVGLFGSRRVAPSERAAP
jgi:hypothetical protein